MNVENDGMLRKAGLIRADWAQRNDCHRLLHCEYTIEPRAKIVSSSVFLFIVDRLSAGSKFFPILRWYMKCVFKVLVLSFCWKINRYEFGSSKYRSTKTMKSPMDRVKKLVICERALMSNQVLCRLPCYLSLDDFIKPDGLIKHSTYVRQIILINKRFFRRYNSIKPVLISVCLFFSQLDRFLFENEHQSRPRLF